MEEKNISTHLFVCTSCSYEPHTDTELASRFRKKVKELCRTEKGLRINASGCLGICERGLNAVLYPSGEWFHDLREGDEGKLAEAVLAQHKLNQASEKQS